MRTTVTIDDQLYAVVRSLAHHNERSISETIAALLHRGLQADLATETSAFAHDALTGFPLLQSGRPITAADARSLEE